MSPNKFDPSGLTEDKKEVTQGAFLNFKALIKLAIASTLWEFRTSLVTLIRAIIRNARVLEEMSVVF